LKDASLVIALVQVGIVIYEAEFNYPKRWAKALVRISKWADLEKVEDDTDGEDENHMAVSYLEYMYGRAKTPPRWLTEAELRGEDQKRAEEKQLALPAPEENPAEKGSVVEKAEGDEEEEDDMPEPEVKRGGRAKAGAGRK